MSSDTVRDLHDRIAREWADKGLLVRGGFEVMRATALPADAPEAAVTSMRFAYMAGAQHLFSTIMSIMDPGSEPTDEDMRRMSLIHDELEQWVREQLELMAHVVRQLEEQKAPKVEFAPGCFDDFPGTQEELQSFIAELHQLAASGELHKHSRQLSSDEVEELRERIEQQAKRPKQ